MIRRILHEDIAGDSQKTCIDSLYCLTWNSPGVGMKGAFMSLLHIWDLGLSQGSTQPLAEVTVVPQIALHSDNLWADLWPWLANLQDLSTMSFTPDTLSHIVTQKMWFRVVILVLSHSENTFPQLLPRPPPPARPAHSGSPNSTVLQRATWKKKGAVYFHLKISAKKSCIQKRRLKSITLWYILVAVLSDFTHSLVYVNCLLITF